MEEPDTGADCLLAFAALGVLPSKLGRAKTLRHNLFVGEGLTAQRTAATRVYIGAPTTRWRWTA